MAKFLDYTGLTTFWDKIKSTFAPKYDDNDPHDETKFYRADGNWAVPASNTATIRNLNVDTNNLDIHIAKGQNHRHSQILILCGNKNYSALISIGFTFLTSPNDDEAAGLKTFPPRLNVIASNNHTNEDYVPELKWIDNDDGSSDIYCKWGTSKRLTVLIASYKPDDISLSSVSTVPSDAKDREPGYGNVRINSYKTGVGSSTQPVYVSNTGLVTTGSLYAGGTAVTLNGSSAAGSSISFYAPTSAGNEGLPLVWSGSRITTTQADTLGNVGTSGSSDSKTAMLLNTDIICNQSSKYTIGIKRLCNNRTYRFDLRNPSIKQVILENNTGTSITVWYSSTSHSVTTANPIILDGGSRSTACSAWVTRINANIYVTYGY